MRLRQIKFLGAGLLALISVVSMFWVFRLSAPALQSGTGEVLQAEVALSPGYSQYAEPGHMVIYEHILTNTGTLTDTFSLTAASSRDWSTVLFNKLYSNTRLLTLQLGPRMTASIGASVTVPNDVISGVVAYTTITATSLTSDVSRAVITDATMVRRSAGIALSRGQSKEGVSGEVVAFTHTITNTGPITDEFVLEAKTQRGWTVELLEGVYQTATIQMPVHLGELDAAQFIVSVTIPSHIPVDTLENVVVTATSLISDAVMSAVTDTITVRGSCIYKLSLPLIQRRGLPHYVKFGVDYGGLTTATDVIEYDFPVAREMGAEWTRVLLPWYLIETSPGHYEWDVYDTVFDRLDQLGVKAMVTVYGAPEWAAEESCGPISDTLAMENFLALAIPRYADVADVWEFVNEPDGKVPHEYGPMIGCWGLHPAEYAQQLQVFYSRVKALDPGALVFFGGLAYDAWHHFERNFFEKALQNGAGPFFDGVSLHYYPINSEDFPTMAHKVNEISDTMSKNGVYSKLIWITETSMWVNARGSLEAQRNFIVQEQVRGFCAGVDNIFWFAVRQVSADPPLHRWLIDMDHEPDNGYYTYQHFANIVEDLYCVGSYHNVPTGIEAYKFAGDKRELYVLWSDTVTKTVSIPSQNDAVLIDRDGDKLAVLPTQSGRVAFEVGARSVFVDIQLSSPALVNNWQPAISPDGRRVVFARQELEDHSDVFLMNSDGSDRRNLTQTPNADEDTPVFSPDGSRIAFASNREGQWDIYLMSISRTNVTSQSVISHPASDELHPSFSPDGRYLAFASDRELGNWDLYTAPITSGMWTRLTTDDSVERFPVFSADGRMLVYRREAEGDSELYTMDVSSKVSRRLTNSPGFDGYPALTPDGSGVVFVSDRSRDFQLYSMNIAGVGGVTLTHHSGYRAHTPRLSNDGHTLIYAIAPITGTYAIYTSSYQSPLETLARRGAAETPGLCDWTSGVLAVGWGTAWQNTGNDTWARWIQDWVDSCGIDTYTITHVNDGLLGYAALMAYKFDPQPSYLAFAQRMADYLMNTAGRTSEGALMHFDDEVWVDTLISVVPFLIEMEQVTGNHNYLDEAAMQVVQHASILQDPATDLCRHAWRESTAEYLSSSYWARGNSWNMIASAQLLSVLPSTHTLRSQIVTIAQSQAQALAANQDASGLWHTVVNRPEFYLESSGSAGIAYGLTLGIQEGWLSSSLEASAQAAWLGLWQNVSADGTLVHVSGPTWPMPEEDYNAITHDGMQLYGQGMGLLFLSSFSSR